MAQLGRAYNSEEEPGIRFQIHPIYGLIPAGFTDEELERQHWDSSQDTTDSQSEYCNDSDDISFIEIECGSESDEQAEQENTNGAKTATPMQHGEPAEQPSDQHDMQAAEGAVHAPADTADKRSSSKTLSSAAH